MTALTITPASVAYVSGPLDKDQVAGEAFDAGDYLYKSAAGTWLKAQCDGTAIEAGSIDHGLALASADAAGARVSVAKAGAIVTIGAGLAGFVYVPGDTAGDLMPTADLNATDKVTPVALGISTTQVQLLGYGYNAGAVVAA